MLEDQRANTHHTKTWLRPVLFAVALFVAVIALTKGSAIAPFVYKLF